MKLFIQIKDGKPFEHPILEDNFVLAFPDVDINNLPPQFAVFERTECNILVETYEVAFSEYAWSEGKVIDLWKTRPMSQEEIDQVNEFILNELKKQSEFAERNTDKNGSEPNVIL